MPLLVLLILAGSSRLGVGHADPSASAFLPQKQKRERFGSSLDRLRWDSANNRAVEKGSNAASSPEAGVLRLSSLLVVLNVLVLDATGRPVTGLTKDDFAVADENTPQDISVFATGHDDSIPRKVILIIDRSGSERAYLESSLQAAKTLVDDLRASDQMAVVTDDIDLVVSYTADHARLKAALDGLGSAPAPGRRASPAGPKTAVFHSRSLQFSALFAALRELVRDSGSRHIIVFQTDGDEAPTLRDQPDAADYAWNMPRRNYGLSDIYAAAQRSSAMIYTIIPSDSLLALDPAGLLERGRSMLERMERARFRSEREYQNYADAHPMSDAKVRLFAERFAAGQSAARHVAELTGGWCAFLQRPQQAASLYSDVLSDMNQRYVIGYYPREAGEQGYRGRLHHVKVSVKSHPEYTVRGRDTYLPPD